MKLMPRRLCLWETGLLRKSGRGEVVVVVVLKYASVVLQNGNRGRMKDT